MSPRERGFSLVEVILALGLLATVLIGILGLFTWAAHLVDSGAQQSEALAVARDILEEMSGLGFSELYEIFGEDGSAETLVVSSDANAYASKWQAALDRSLRGSRAEIRLQSLASGTPPALRAAQAIRIEVTVFWSEGPRERRLRLATVRM